jgi:predicted Zn-dependent protease
MAVPAGRWRRLFLLAVLLAGLGGGAYLGWRGLRDQAEREELRAAELLPFSDAEPRLLRLAERRPDDARVARALAMGYLADRRYAKAEPYFARWCELRPNDTEALRERIELWRGWQQTHHAAADAERLLELEPDDTKLRRQLSGWLFGLGRLEDAERQCRLSLDATPHDPALLHLQAALYHRRGQDTEAADLVDRLLREHPRFADALLLRGVLHLHAGRPAEAIPWYRRALAVEGKHQRDAYYELSLALDRTGQAEEAHKALAESRLLQEVDLFNTQTDRDNVDLQMRFAERLVNAGRAALAVPMLTRLVQQHPNNSAVQKLLAAAQKDQGRGTNP